jgi:hypothetical protein
MSHGVPRGPGLRSWSMCQRSLLLDGRIQSIFFHIPLTREEARKENVKSKSCLDFVNVQDTRLQTQFRVHAFPSLFHLPFLLPFLLYFLNDRTHNGRVEGKTTQMKERKRKAKKYKNWNGEKRDKGKKDNRK